MNANAPASFPVISPRSRARLLAALSVSSLLLAVSSKADTSLWSGSVSGAWNTSSSNWTNSGAGTYTNGDIVQFGDTGGANLTISVAAAVTPTSVAFTDTGTGTNAYLFTGSAINGTGTTVTLNSGFGGSVSLGMANGYTGGTTVNSGTLIIANNNAALGTGTLTLAGGTFRNNGARSITNAMNVTGTAIVQAQGGDLTLGGVVTGSGTINVNQGATGGAATVQFQNNNLSGFTGTIQYDGGAQNNLFFNTALNTTAKFVLSGTNTQIRDLRIAPGSVIGELSGTGGRMTARTAGNITVSQNTNSTYSGIIDNNGAATGLIKAGTGSLTLAGTTYVYSGTTEVTGGGALLINGAKTGTGTITVTNGVFGGNGSAAGAVSVASGAILRGGDGTAASDDLSLSGNVTFNDGAIIQLTLGASGSHSSLTRTGGTWLFDADQAFNFQSISAGFYNNIITGLTGSESGLSSIGSWTIQNSGWIGTFVLDGTAIDLTVTSAIPEPSTFAVIAGALALGGAAVRRRRPVSTSGSSV